MWCMSLLNCQMPCLGQQQAPGISPAPPRLGRRQLVAGLKPWFGKLWVMAGSLPLVKIAKVAAWGLLASSLSGLSSMADERRFTYVYEPETLPRGSFEVENWVTLRTGRGQSVGQENYRRWDFRQEIEYGITDWYTAALYLNETAENFREPATHASDSAFSWNGISLENRFNVLNPATHLFGLTLYVEGRYSGEEAVLEQKLILGQRRGNWKWAFNLEHESEWAENLREVEGELGASFGLARDFGKHWALGLELRNENIFPEYQYWENSALFLGPVLSFRQEKWWAALTVLPQIQGWNDPSSRDGHPHLELRDHEKVNIRLLIGFNF